MRFSIFLLLAALVPTVVHSQDRVSPDDRAEVLAVVQRFFDAMRSRDTAAMRAQFHPDARFFGMRTKSDGVPAVQVLTVSDFVSFVGRDRRASWTERAFDAEVRVHKSLATVWAQYDFHFGSTFSHCGVDAVQLLRTNAGWKITSISDTYETDGCSRRPPPEHNDK